MAVSRLFSATRSSSSRAIRSQYAVSVSRTSSITARRKSSLALSSRIPVVFTAVQVGFQTRLRKSGTSAATVIPESYCGSRPWTREFVEVFWPNDSSETTALRNGTSPVTPTAPSVV